MDVQTYSLSISKVIMERNIDIIPKLGVLSVM